MGKLEEPSTPSEDNTTLLQHDSWVCCDACGQWRRVSHAYAETLVDDSPWCVGIGSLLQQDLVVEAVAPGIHRVSLAAGTVRTIQTQHSPVAMYQQRLQTITRERAQSVLLRCVLTHSNTADFLICCCRRCLGTRTIGSFDHPYGTTSLKTSTRIDSASSRTMTT